MEIDASKAIKISISAQMKAASATLKYCVDTCPDSEWDGAHGDYPFSQVVFHAIFYTDFYLGKDAVPFKDQSFHRLNAQTFADYEELEDRLPIRLYKKEFCERYLAFCREKIDTALADETADSLFGDSCISFRRMTRIELYIYSIRHLQHHAAQLGLRLQSITGREMPWVSSG